MIPRYARPEMTAIWSPETRYGVWLEIETLAMEAMAELGTIPKSAAEAYRRRGKFDVARIDEIEREVKHDVIAFLTSVAECGLCAGVVAAVVVCAVVVVMAEAPMHATAITRWVARMVVQSSLVHDRGSIQNTSQM